MPARRMTGGSDRDGSGTRPNMVTAGGLLWLPGLNRDAAGALAAFTCADIRAATIDMRSTRRDGGKCGDEARLPRSIHH